MNLVNRSTKHLEYVKTVSVEPADQTYPRLDKPFTVECADGRLFTVKMKMVGGHHDHTKSIIASSRSTDKGFTFEEENILFRTDEEDLNLYTMGLVLKNEQLYLTVLTIHAVDSTTCTLYVSSDQGRSFTKVSDLWTRSDGYRLCGYLEILQNGRLLQPIYDLIRPTDTVWSKNENYVSYCLFSDDDGRTWQRSENCIYLPLRGAQEPSVAQMQDQSLIVSVRTQLGSVFFARSDDGGLTFSPAWPTGLNASEGITHLKRIPGTDRLLVFWFDAVYQPFHGHFGDRRTIGMAISDDYGQNWRKIGALAGDGITHFDAKKGESFSYNHPICTFLQNGDAYVNYLTVTGFGYQTSDFNYHGFAMQKTGYIRDSSKYRMHHEAAIVDGDWLRSV